MLISRFKGFSGNYLFIAVILTSILLILGIITANAQDEEPAHPLVHTVAEGENLTVIAEQYEVTVEALRVVNNLRNADVLRVGQELVIPGGEGELVAAVHRVQLGDSLASIAHEFGTSIEEVMEANLLVNRDYVPAAGQFLSVISRTGSEQPYHVQGVPYIVEEGESLLEIAASHDLPVAQLARANDLAFPVRLFPGQRLRIPGDGQYQDLPGKWLRVEVKPQSISQGDTVSIYAENLLEGQPTGQFAGQELHFTPKGDGYVALVGIDAFFEPGSYTLELGGEGEQPWAGFAQQLPVSSANYITQEITVSEDLNDLLDPEVRQKEDRFLHLIYSNFSEERRWEGPFQVPVTDTVVTAYYGGGRSYNEGPVTIYHTGTDFDGDIGTPILSAAEGTVVYSDSLELRGQTVIIDHGLGVMTGYYHLSEIFVDVGEDVAAAQPIGLGGSTGLSTGPHLHWDLRIMDVPVDGMRWTEEYFP
jgi:murein DD-endopeptidase MepM/ murein hydrolase activator NlpD